MTIAEAEPSYSKEMYYGYLDKPTDEPIHKEDWARFTYELPQYIARDLTEHIEKEEYDIAEQLLELFFHEEDFKEKFSSEDPTILFVDASPKHREFQLFRKRIQFLQGGNKTGKSANGAKKVIDIIFEKLDGVHVKPSRKRKEPFQVWVCNETRTLLKEAVLQLKKFLKPGTYREITGAKSLTDQIKLTTPNGSEVEITMMPYEAGVKAFESGNIDLIWCDEPPPLPYFGAIWGRFVKTRGLLLITATTVQGDSQYLDQMINGEGPKAELHEMGLIDHVRMQVWDNLTLSQREIDEFVAGYAKDSWEYRSRVLGEYAEMSGLVFKFNEFIMENGIPKEWGIYNPDDFNLEAKLKSVRVDGLDYGRGVEFAQGQMYVEEDGTLRYDDEIYQAGLESTDQARLMKDKWKTHGKPVVVVADCQIANENHSAKGPSILIDYVTELGEEWTVPFRTEIEDKKDVQTSIALLGKLITEINPKTGRPYLLINIRCRGLINELKNLAWKPANESSTKQKEYTKGKNHAVAFMRYLCKSGILRDNLIFQLYKDIAAETAAQNKSAGDGYIDPEAKNKNKMGMPAY